MAWKIVYKPNFYSYWCTISWYKHQAPEPQELEGLVWFFKEIEKILGFLVWESGTVVRFGSEWVPALGWDQTNWDHSTHNQFHCQTEELAPVLRTGTWTNLSRFNKTVAISSVRDERQWTRWSICRITLQRFAGRTFWVSPNLQTYWVIGRSMFLRFIECKTLLWIQTNHFCGTSA